MYCIRKFTFGKEFDRSIHVKKLFPEIQVEIFKWKNYSKEGGDQLPFDKVGFLVACIHNRELFYEYMMLDEININQYVYKDEIIQDLKDKISKVIKNYDSIQSN